MSTSAGSRLAKRYEVTGRGRPVAVLAPLPESTPLAGLVAGGRLRPALRDRRRLPRSGGGGDCLRSALRWPSIAPATVDRVRRLLRTGDGGRHRKRNRDLAAALDGYDAVATSELAVVEVTRAAARDERRLAAAASRDYPSAPPGDNRAVRRGWRIRPCGCPRVPRGPRNRRCCGCRAASGWHVRRRR